MFIPFVEPKAPRYIYVDPETNQVHLLVPVVGGQDISTDNTCKSTVAMNEFFQQGGGALRELNTYKSALEFDLQWLDSSHPQKALKEARLQQIDAYIKAVPAMANQYKTAINTLLETPSNLYSIQLRPKELDNQSQVINPVFSLNRAVSGGETLSALYNAMYQALPNATIAPIDPRSRLTDEVMKSLPESADFKTIQQALTDQCQALWQMDVDFTSATKDKTNLVKGDDLQPWIDSVMGFTANNPGTPEEYTNALLNTCAPNLWYNLPVSPFYSEQGNTDRTERLSIATQFFLAHVNTYCAANGISNKNFGAVLDGSSDLSDEVAATVVSALGSGADVEHILCTFMNERADVDKFGVKRPNEFELNRPLTEPDIQRIKENFTRNYNTVTATKENPHMDDFMIMETQASEGRFVKHQGHICVHFSELSNPVLTHNWSQHHYELPGTNDHVKADDLELSVEEFLSLMKDYDYSQLEKLPYKIRLEWMRLRSPTFQLRTFLHDVAKGKQDESGEFLKNQLEKTQELLTSVDTFTDYSGRTFTCTAYEYAYWAKDKHMCRMLEAQMDDVTKALMRERIDVLEADGLTYTQHGNEVTGSKCFGISPLKKAYEDYIRVFTAWQQNGCLDSGEADVIDAWMNVGMKQRDLPVHYVNEYFRKDRSFDPLPAFNELNLPRELTYHNYHTSLDETLFSTIFTDFSGLGIDFVFVRASEDLGTALGLGSHLQVLNGALIDLAAIARLDEVRTVDLTQSRENLNQPTNQFGRR